MTAEGLDNEEIIYTSDPFVTKGLTHRDILISAKGVHYVLTNKRAMVVLVDRQGQKIIQECNLADTVPIVHKKRSINLSQMNRQTGIVTAKTSVTVGDVVFMQKTIPKVIFRDVEDPDGILRTVEQIKRSMLM